jgi:hypothetical protein
LSAVNGAALCPWVDPDVLDIVLCKPFKPAFLVFGEFDFGAGGAVEGRDDRHHAIIKGPAGVFFANPEFALPQLLWCIQHARGGGEVGDIVPKAGGHRTGWDVRPIESVDGDRHGNQGLSRGLMVHQG